MQGLKKAAKTSPNRPTASTRTLAPAAETTTNNNKKVSGIKKSSKNIKKNDKNKNQNTYNINSVNSLY